MGGDPSRVFFEAVMRRGYFLVSFAVASVQRPFVFSFCSWVVVMVSVWEQDEEEPGTRSVSELYFPSKS